MSFADAYDMILWICVVSSNRVFAWSAARKSVVGQRPATVHKVVFDPFAKGTSEFALYRRFA